MHFVPAFLPCFDELVERLRPNLEKSGNLEMTPQKRTYGWSLRHCLRSSASRLLQIPDMVYGLCVVVV